MPVVLDHTRRIDEVSEGAAAAKQKPDSIGEKAEDFQYKQVSTREGWLGFGTCEKQNLFAST